MKPRFALTIPALLLILAALPLAAQSPPSRPPGPPPPPGGGPAHLELALRAIDLTPAQKDQVDSLLEARHDAAEADRPASEAAFRSLMDQVQAERFDEKAIRAAAAAAADAAGDRAVADAALLRDVRALLTPAQREKFDKLIVPSLNEVPS
jgi:Spy/CpxP family protein refolding chaperone